MFSEPVPLKPQLAEVELVVGGRVVVTTAAMVPGECITWEGALAFNTDDRDEMKMLNELNEIRVTTETTSKRYTPVVVDSEGHIHSASLLGGQKQWH